MMVNYIKVVSQFGIVLVLMLPQCTLRILLDLILLIDTDLIFSCRETISKKMVFLVVFSLSLHLFKILTH